MLHRLLNYVRSAFFSTESVDALSTKRSGKWGSVRKKHLEIEPTCAACGGTKGLQVHHVIPIHVDNTKELDHENLITLCEENNCHHAFGHLYSWFSYNPNVREDVAAMLKKVKERPRN